MSTLQPDEMQTPIYVGQAGWTVPKTSGARFPSAGSHLERFAQTLTCVEINSAFYREHKPETYERWRESVPDDFRFAVKLERYYTHEKKLHETDRLQEKLAGPQRLGKKFGVLLVQLPPSLKFDAEIAGAFFGGLRDLYEGPVALEPRHPTWILDSALRLMEEFALSKVLADPDPCPLSRPRRERVMPIAYFRLHGTPEMYRSSYEPERLERLAKALVRERQAGRPSWCIFDNTTFGHSAENALDLLAMISREEAQIQRASLPTSVLRSST